LGGRLLLVSNAILTGLFLATEVFAYTVRLDASLGAPWWRHGSLAVYAPWSILLWAWQWGWIAPKAFQGPGGLGLLVTGIILLKAWPRQRTPRKVQAHWATRAELRKAELLGEPGSGVVLGTIGSTVLRYSGPGHLLVEAGTQTGKTSSIVKPTAFEFEGSMILHDPKGGLYQWLLPDRRRWANSAGYRNTLGKVVLLAPLQEDTDCFNLWDTVRIGTDDAYRDAQLISMYLANPEGRVTTDSTSQHFTDLVNLFMPGVFLYGLQTGLATTGAQFNDLVNGSEWADVLTVMKAYPDPLVHNAALLGAAPGDNDAGSLKTSLARALSIFNDPRIARMTSRSTFALQDLREADKPCTVYLSVPFNDQERLRVLTVLFLRLMLDHCTSRLTGWKHRMLFVGEEFPSLKRCDFISHGLNHAAEFGLQYLLITPSMQALEDVYGRYHNFWEGCRVQVAFGLSDARVARGVSDSLGTREEKHFRVTTQKGGRHSTSEDVKDEPLLNVTGLLDLDEREMLVKAGRYKRVVQQSRYYEHPLWERRSRLPMPQRLGA
jgi:type IV secretion system protein VirD4